MRLAELRLGVPVIVALAAVLAGSAADAASPVAQPTPAPNVTSNGPVTFGIQTASALGSAVPPGCRPYFSFGVAPGSMITDHVAITNYSARPLRLNVYPTDSVITSDGGFALGSAAQTAVDVGAWTAVGSGPTVITVPARSV